MKLAQLFGLLVAALISTAANARYWLESHPLDYVGRTWIGGITLPKPEKIRIVEEAVTISVSNIGVRYKFHNETDHDIKSIVTLPMSEYGFEDGFAEGIWHKENLMTEGDFIFMVGGSTVISHINRSAV